MDKPKITDAEFTVVAGPRGPKPHEPAIHWRNVPYFLWVVLVLVAAQFLFHKLMGH